VAEDVFSLILIEIDNCIYYDLIWSYFIWNGQYLLNWLSILTVGGAPCTESIHNLTVGGAPCTESIQFSKCVSGNTAELIKIS
jgi:hypothetical protein